jgi:hypothetical protein
MMKKKDGRRKNADLKSNIGIRREIPLYIYLQ